MIVDFKLSETMEVKAALQNRIKKLKELSIEDKCIDAMIKNTEKSLKKLEKAEKAEAKKIMRGEG